MNTTYSSIRKTFENSLNSLYEENEIKALFYFYFEEKWKVKKFEMSLHPDTVIEPRMEEEIEQDLQRLDRGEPVQYVTGSTTFYNLPFRVSPVVLIPRPETEELVQWTLRRAETVNRPLRILDFCTGSGAIAVALACHLPDATVYATDYAEEVLQFARKNAGLNNADVHFLKHDLLRDGIGAFDTSFDIIVSNPPYIPLSRKSQLHTNVADFEPSVALFVPDEEAIVFYERIAVLGRDLLKKNGCLCFETHEDFQEEIVIKLKNLSYHNINMMEDINGNPRFISCTK